MAAMKILATLACAAVLLPACSTTDSDNAGRNWQRAECDRIIDNDARLRCIKRVDDDYGRVSREREETRKK